MLYTKTNYTADISYLTNIFITEYDISKCNINVLFTKGIIDQAIYDYLYNAKRIVRQVYIGKLQKSNPRISDELKKGIIEAKKKLFEANNLLDSQILSIKNDAVFVINRKLQYTKFGLIEFRPKGLYTSFYKFMNMEIYYYYNNVTKAEYIEVKGISDDNLEKHKGYFLQFLQDIFYSIQISGPEVSLRMLKDYYNEYISRQLPVEHYRKFDAGSNYSLICRTAIGTGYEIDRILPKDLQYLDITYNLNILRQLQRYIISMYFNKNK